MTSTPLPGRPELVIVLPDIRSAQNVGAIWRTADAVGARQLITCGYTPHPRVAADPRPPHVAMSNERAITKAALGAEHTVPHEHYATLAAACARLRHNHYRIVALEQAENTQPLFDYQPPARLALVLGNEVTGLTTAELTLCDEILELPMLGRKESLNVAVAAGIAMYRLRHLG